LEALSNLEELNVGVTSIDDVGAMNLSNLTNLKRLTLRRNQITDVGIGTLKTLVDLTGLVLNGVHLHDHGMASVVRYPSFRILLCRDAFQSFQSPDLVSAEDQGGKPGSNGYKSSGESDRAGSQQVPSQDGVDPLSLLSLIRLLDAALHCLD